MEGGVQEEQGEVASVALAHASAYPGAVMVMLFYAYITAGAMEGPRRS